MMGRMKAYRVAVWCCCTGGICADRRKMFWRKVRRESKKEIQQWRMKTIYPQKSAEE